MLLKLMTCSQIGALDVNAPNMRRARPGGIYKSIIDAMLSTQRSGCLFSV
jgi:hypothetical protein